jgi:membrane-associated HD superfamily phosphohydrolase
VDEEKMAALPWFVVDLVEILVAFIVLWLSTRLVAGAEKTGKKLVMVLLIAIIGFFVIPVLQSIPVMGGLGAIIGYTLVIVLVHSLVDVAWDKALLIAFIFYVIMYILLIIIGPTYLGPFVP